MFRTVSETHDET